MNNQQFIFVVFGSVYLFGLTGILIVMRIDHNHKKRAATGEPGLTHDRLNELSDRVNPPSS
jgi:hypothetical protein